MEELACNEGGSGRWPLSALGVRAERTQRASVRSYQLLRRRGTGSPSGFGERGSEEGQTVLHHKALLGLVVDPEPSPGCH